MPIKIHRKLPDTETYACSKNDARDALGDLRDIAIDFGLATHFEFDAKSHRRPDLKGTVLVSVIVDRELATSVQLYPLRRSDYSEREHQAFVQTELPRIRRWITRTVDTPEAQVTGNRQLLVELGIDGYLHQELTFP